MATIHDKNIQNTLLFEMIQKNKEYENPNQDLLEDEPEGEKEPLNEIQPYDLVLDEKLDVD